MQEIETKGCTNFFAAWSTLHKFASLGTCVWQGANGRMEKKKSRDELIKEYIDDIKNKKRVKFPWSSKEIDSATSHFSKHITKLQIEAES